MAESGGGKQEAVGTERDSKRVIMRNSENFLAIVDVQIVAALSPAAANHRPSGLNAIARILDALDAR